MYLVHYYMYLIFIFVVLIFIFVVPNCTGRATFGRIQTQQQSTMKPPSQPRAAELNPEAAERSQGGCVQLFPGEIHQHPANCPI